MVMVPVSTPSGVGGRVCHWEVRRRLAVLVSGNLARSDGPLALTTSPESPELSLESVELSLESDELSLGS